VAETFTPELPQQDRTAGSAYGKFKTTVYLPKNLKRALEIEAAARRVSDADLIRHAVSAEVGVMDGRLPPSDVFSGGADLARHVDEHLDGFGQW
jgi:hypothetical protein